jgi:hypothetical protein
MRPVEYRNVIKHNQHLLCQLGAMGIPPDPACEIIVCAFQGVKW